MTTPVPTARRELTAAVALCAAAGGLALSAGGQPWAEVSITRQAPLPPLAETLTGSDLAPLVPATGLLLLAAVVAVLAVRGWGRVLVGLLVAAAGVAAAGSAVAVLAGSVDVGSGDLGPQVELGQARVAADVSAGWPVLALAAGGLGLLAGVLVVLRGRRWPGMGQRYERAPGTAPDAAGPRPRPRRPVSAEDRHQAAWKALDGGSDPTADPDDEDDGLAPAGPLNPDPVVSEGRGALYSVPTDPTGEGTSQMRQLEANLGDDRP